MRHPHRTGAVGDAVITSRLISTAITLISIAVNSGRMTKDWEREAEAWLKEARKR
jgi:hypothetical protein